MKLFSKFLITLSTTAFFISFLNIYIHLNKNINWSESYVFIGLTIPFFTFFFQSYLNLYSSLRIQITEIFLIFLKWLIIFLIFTMIGFLTKLNDSVSRLLIGFLFLSSTIFNLIFYLIINFIEKKFNNPKKLLIIYDIDPKKLTSQLNDHYEILETLNFNNLNESIIDQKKPETIILYLSFANVSFVKNFSVKFLDASYEILWLPSDENNYNFEDKFFSFFGKKAFSINSSPLSNRANGLIKRCIDFFGSLLLILLLTPLLLIIFVLIRIDSKGFPIYLQNRNGLNGKVFSMFKFRSMTLKNNSDFSVAKKDDVRITKVGKFIRRYSLDELPQLFNVLIGQMSLVGPRPHAVEMNDILSNQIDGYMARHRVKPGITGLAQINGFRGGAELSDMKKRLEFDLKYINSWSLIGDIKILLGTFPSLFSKDIF